MPNLGLHIGFALDCAERLGHPLLKEYQGAFLLGSTTPDIRLSLGWDRERTHFFKLDSDVQGTGVPRLLDENPNLRSSERLNRETTAFLLGYMSHLETDETWIVQVWRRFFGEGSTLGQDPLANVYDRLFQFEMDRVERQNVQDLEGAVASIRDAYAGVDIGFIDGPALQKWQHTVVARLDRDLPWERFRTLVSRVHRAVEEDAVDGIMERLPTLLERVHTEINQEELAAFREQAIQAFVSRATTYLDGKS